MDRNNAVGKFLGPREIDVIARLTYEKLSVVTVKQFDRLFGFNTNLRKQIIFRLKKKRILAPISKGIYFFSPLESGPLGSRINEYLIPPILFPKGNYYVGYSTMYHYYGLTDQIFQTFYILNTSRQRKRVICGVQFKLLKISPKRMYGLEKMRIRDSEIIASDRERTLVDLVYFPDPVGGLKGALEILKQQVGVSKVDLKKLVRYAVLFPGLSTRKRIGFALEQCGVLDATLRPLIKSIAKTSLVTLLGSQSRQGVINHKWRVILDAAQQ